MEGFFVGEEDGDVPGGVQAGCNFEKKWVRGTLSMATRAIFDLALA